jgi:cellulose biosynthesis protein BcsQ
MVFAPVVVHSVLLFAVDVYKQRMSNFKILITSQKGGVGKSTVAANLAAFMRRLGKSVTLIDFDSHASSSNWLNHAPQIGISVQRHMLPFEQAGKRPILDARLQLHRAADRTELVVCDLTWTDTIYSELMLEFDLVIVPTSVSEIELSATADFLKQHRWVFDNTVLANTPTLLMCPTRVRAEQLRSNVFSTQRFPVSFMLTPPILEAQSARDMFEQGYLSDLADDCGSSFKEFGKAVIAALNVRQAHLASREAKKTTVKRALTSTQAKTNSLASIRIPQFFKRMSLGMSNK